MSARKKAALAAADYVRREPTREDLEAAYERACAHALVYWNGLVENGAKARAAYSSALAAGAPGELAHRVSWANGIEEDLLAVLGARALAAVDRGTPILDVLKYQAEEIASRQQNNSERGGSSSDFSNAISHATREVAAKYRERVLWLISDLTVARAELEVI